MRYEIGGVEIFVLRDGLYRTDGGAAFGIIPRPLWSAFAPPDRRGRVPMAVNCFLVRTKRMSVLVDTGIGNKLPEKNRDIYAVAEDGRLTAELAAAGVHPEEVDAVVFTHLHWDHAGGATTRDETGLRVTFPHAVHYVQERDWEEAVCPNERTRGGFAPEDFLPLREEGRLRLLEGDSFLNKNVSLVVTGGHTTAHQIVRVASGGEVAYICGDLIPATPFLHPAYATAYDLFPLTTLEAKMTTLRRAEKRNALLFLAHELQTPVGRVAADENGRFSFLPVEPTGNKPALDSPTPTQE